MRHAIPEVLDLIRKFEGFSEKMYLCPAGYLTIGYGHVILASEKERFVAGINEQKAIDVLKQDVMAAEQAVLRLISVPLTDGQFGALVSFTYNLGSGALQRSTLRQKVNRKEDSEVPAEFMKWIWAKNRKLEGLIRRRSAEALLYQS
jgi:GH24 family phage-related lysozyme (muramidase)